MSEILGIAFKLHGTVKYGGGNTTMFDQLLETTKVIRLFCINHSHLEDAAMLHKSQERSKISVDNSPLSDAEIESLAGRKVLGIIQELSSEPSDKGMDKAVAWDIKARWAEDLSVEAQTLLLAEKHVNYTTSRDNPNPNKPTEWHLDYMRTRQQVVEACTKAREAFPALYEAVCSLHSQVLIALRARQTKDRGSAEASPPL